MSPSGVRSSILVHGGAWAIPRDELEAHKVGVHRAALVGFDVLLRGGRALDAVQQAVEHLEADESFNAGRGAVLDENGEVCLDAGIMDGETLEAGAVASVKGLQHAVRVARLVMDRSPHVLLVAEGALQFAEEQGVQTCDPSVLVTPREKSRLESVKRGEQNESTQPADTVGAVACDVNGHVASATSTGGSTNKRRGRVGDSPLVGAGFYADDRLGAASSTGSGEHILRLVMAHRAIEYMGTGISVGDAAQLVIRALETRTKGQGGIILVNSQGELGYSFNTPHMAYAYLRDGMTEPEVGV